MTTLHQERSNLVSLNAKIATLLDDIMRTLEVSGETRRHSWSSQATTVSWNLKIASHDRQVDTRRGVGLSS